jgi:hypothetical protein
VAQADSGGGDIGDTANVIVPPCSNYFAHDAAALLCCVPSSLPSALLLWSFAPLVISIISECVVSHGGVAYVRAYNIIDMCAATPLYIVIAVILLRAAHVSQYHVPIAWSCW